MAFCKLFPLAIIRNSVSETNFICLTLSNVQCSKSKQSLKQKVKSPNDTVNFIP